MKTSLLLFLALLAPAWKLGAQASTPDCQFTFQAAVAGAQSPPISNRFTTSGGSPGCSAWIFKYWTNASSATSIQIEGAADAVTGGVHAPTGAYTALTVASATGSGSNPETAATQGGAVLCCDYYPWIRMHVNTLTSSGAGTSITVRAYGYKNNSALNGGGGGGAPSGAAGGDLAGFYPNPTVAQVNGAVVPASAAVLGSNASRQLIAANANGVSAPAYVAGGGTAQAQTATLSPAIAALVAGQTQLCWLPLHANSGAAPTLAVNGLAPTAIVKVAGAALAASDLTTTAVACAIYDGTSFELQNPQTVASGGGTIAATTSTLAGDGAGNAIAVTGSPTDCVLVNGTSTACAGGGGLLPWNPTASTPPTLTNWTQINPTSGASFADVSNGVTILVPSTASADYLTALLLAAPGASGTAFTVTVRVLGVSQAANFVSIAPLVVSDGTLYETSGGSWASPPTLLTRKWATPISHAAGNYSNFNMWSDTFELWFRLQYTGTGGNLVYSYSPSGATGTFVAYETHSATAYLIAAPASIGFGLSLDASVATLVELVYWAVTTP